MLKTDTFLRYHVYKTIPVNIMFSYIFPCLDIMTILHGKQDSYTFLGILILREVSDLFSDM